MEAIVFEYDEQTEREIFCLRNGKYAGKRFFANLQFCESPVCLCKTVHFCCSPVDDAAGASTTPLYFMLDLNTKEIKASPGRTISPDALRLGEDLIKEMGLEDWRLLDNLLRSFKARKTEEADFTTLEVSFPDQAIENPSSLVSILEVLPWSVPFCLFLEDEIWVMRDYYCCNPDCDCADVVVVFLCVGEHADGTYNVAQASPEAVINTRTGAIAPVEPPWNSEPSLETLFQALLQSELDVVDILDERNRNLRVLYKNNSNRNRKGASFLNDLPFETKSPFISEQSNKPKPKPNDPCSCGSGKKYKKCCGRLT